MAISNELRKLVDPNNECCCEHCLGNKCKEWALKKGYILHSSLSTFTVMDKQDGISYYGNGFDNEPEAIFKACQWILDNKEIKWH